MIASGEPKKGTINPPKSERSVHTISIPLQKNPKNFLPHLAKIKIL
jgi:hypothetical protein